MGLFLGPMVVTAFLAFWDIYRRDYQALPELPEKRGKTGPGFFRPFTGEDQPKEIAFKLRDNNKT
jgi:hypothetical protein